jgi:hypothetical protein
MSVSVHKALRENLSSACEAFAEDRARALKKQKHAGPRALPALEQAEVAAAVARAWAEAGAGESTETIQDAEKDALRSVLDLAGREIAVRPLLDGTLPEPAEGDSDVAKGAFQTLLQDRLDVALALFEHAAEVHPGTPPQHISVFSSLTCSRPPRP